MPGRTHDLPNIRSVPVNGYTRAKCRIIHRHHWVGFHIPGYKHKELEMYVGTRNHHGVYVIVAVVQCPSGEPANAVCFRILEYDLKTGKPINHFAQPIAFGHQPVWFYDPATGKYVKLSQNSYGRYQTSYPGLYAFIP